MNTRHLWHTATKTLSQSEKKQNVHTTNEWITDSQLKKIIKVASAFTAIVQQLTSLWNPKHGHHRRNSNECRGLYWHSLQGNSIEFVTAIILLFAITVCICVSSISSRHTLVDHSPVHNRMPVFMRRHSGDWSTIQRLWAMCGWVIMGVVSSQAEVCESQLRLHDDVCSFGANFHTYQTYARSSMGKTSRLLKWHYSSEILITTTSVMVMSHKREFNPPHNIQQR